MKSWEDDHDTNEKNRLRQLLKTYFGLHAFQDETLFFSKLTGKLSFIHQQQFTSKEDILRFYHVHRPDLFIKTRQIVIEIDGIVHWTNSHAVKRTNERNKHYEDANLQFVWLTADEVNYASNAELVDKLALMLNLTVNLP